MVIVIIIIIIIKKKNYFRNELNLDHLKDLYSKKTDDVNRPTSSGLKSKMDLFYKELNQYKNENNYKKQTLNSYLPNDKNFNNNKIVSNTQYTNYIKNSNNNNLNNLNKNLNLNYQQNFEINKKLINKNNSYNANNLSYNEIHAFKQYLKDLSKEEIYNLPYNIKSELMDIFNILSQKLND